MHEHAIRGWSRWTLVLTLGLCLAATETLRAEVPLAPPVGEGELADLIKQLGAEDFAARETAQSKLAQLGLEAFDALHVAQNDNDPEVALRARHLVRSMSVRWFQESDAPAVVRILSGYGDQSEGERRVRIEKLASLAGGQGVLPLCRLARFETVDVLSKAAALKVMEQPAIADENARQTFAKAIAAVVGSSQRPAATWLRLYCRTLLDPASALADWDRASGAEHEALDKHPEQTSREIVRDLYRWQVELLSRLERNDEAIAVIRRTFKLLDGTPEQVKEVAGWLIHRGAYAVVLEVAERFGATFDDHPELLYRLAEAQLKLGKTAEAEATAARALAVRADNLDEHLLVGTKLQEIGLHDWAQREFRQIVTTTTPGSVLDFQARFQLSELLHDQGQEQAAGETLEPLCELMDKDESAKATCERVRGEPGGVYSRMHYFFARALVEQQKFAEAQARLEKGVEHDPTDADALIALYRLPDQSAERQAKTKQLIEDAAKLFKQQYEQLRDEAEKAPTEQLQEQLNYSVSIMCNQYAWLVGNTLGDYDEAIELSHRSLEIRPAYPGYLDTLGRCYYTKGDLENAVKYQSQAAKLDPHSGLIRRQLELFQKALAARGAKPDDSPRDE
ncbi:MAG: tetratricopeptide repeat protein [Pirellulaceae bacterium]